MSARRILLIDNDTEFQTRLQENLAPYGFEVYVADEDPASLQSVTDLGPEALFIAVELPDKTGYSLCNKAKKGVAKQLPVVLTTASVPPSGFASHRKLKVHADEYLDKRGLTDQDLLHKLDALIGLGGVIEGDDDDMELSVDVEEIAVDDISLEEEFEGQELSVADIEIQDDFASDFDDGATRVAAPSMLVDAGIDAETDAAFEALSFGEDIPSAESVIVEAAQEDSFADPLPTSVEKPAEFLAREQEQAGDMMPPPLEEVTEVPASPQELADAVEQADASASIEATEAAAEAIVDDAMLDEPIVEEAVVEQPVVEEPVVAEPAAAEPAAAEAPSAGVPQAVIEVESAPMPSGDGLDLGLDAVAELAQEEKSRVNPAENRVKELEAEVERLNNSLSKRADTRDSFDREREFLNLREQMNKKEKELLEQREQLGQKDRSILDLKEQLSKLQKSAAATEQQLSETDGKLTTQTERANGLEAERDKANEQVIDLESQIADRKKELAERATELAAAKQDAEKALQEAQATHESALGDLTREHEQAAAAEREKLAAQAEQAKQEALAAAEENKQQALAAAEQDKQKALAAAAEQKDQELAAAKAEHEAAIERAKAEDAGARQALEDQYAGKFVRLQQERETAVAEADKRREAELAEAATQKEQALAEAEAARQRDLAEAEETRKRDVAAAEKALRGAHAAATAALEEKHRAALAALEEQKTGVETQLAESKSEGETLRGALADANQDIGEKEQHIQRLDDTIAGNEARIAAFKQQVADLEKENANYQEQVLKAYQRIKADQDVAARAKKAMAIALTLLDGQDDAPDAPAAAATDADS